MTRVLKSLALLAAVLVGSNASPISALQARTSYAADSVIVSNCAAVNVTEQFCDFQYLSYNGFALTGLDPTKACDAFNNQCDTYAFEAPPGTSVTKHCTSDRANKVITASCVKIDCQQYKAFGYTGVAAAEVPSDKRGVSTFYPTLKCTDGEGFCSPKLDISRTTPLQFEDINNNKIKEVCPDFIY